MRGAKRRVGVLRDNNLGIVFYGSDSHILGARYGALTHWQNSWLAKFPRLILSPIFRFSKTKLMGNIREYSPLILFSKKRRENYLGYFANPKVGVY